MILGGSAHPAGALPSEFRIEHPTRQVWRPPAAAIRQLPSARNVRNQRLPVAGTRASQSELIYIGASGYRNAGVRCGLREFLALVSAGTKDSHPAGVHGAHGDDLGQGALVPAADGGGGCNPICHSHTPACAFDRQDLRGAPIRGLVAPRCGFFVASIHERC